jgi:hypothetical protein
MAWGKSKLDKPACDNSKSRCQVEGSIGKMATDHRGCSYWTISLEFDSGWNEELRTTTI